MPLLALDLLARIISRRVDAGPPFSALFTLWLSMCVRLSFMSKEIKELLERVGGWPNEAQDELIQSAHFIERRHATDDELTEEDWRIIDDRKRYDDIATDEEMEPMFSKYRRA